MQLNIAESLEPGYIYTITIFAHNEVGLSKPTLVRVAVNQEPVHQSSQSGNFWQIVSIVHFYKTSKGRHKNKTI